MTDFVVVLLLFKSLLMLLQQSADLLQQYLNQQWRRIIMHCNTVTVTTA